MSEDFLQECRQRVMYYLYSPGEATPNERHEELARWIHRTVRRAAGRSVCCDAPMSGGVQCLNCGADGTDEGDEA